MKNEYVVWTDRNNPGLIVTWEKDSKIVSLSRASSGGTKGFKIDDRRLRGELTVENAEKLARKWFQTIREVFPAADGVDLQRFRFSASGKVVQ